MGAVGSSSFVGAVGLSSFVRAAELMSWTLAGPQVPSLPFQSDQVHEVWEQTSWDCNQFDRTGRDSDSEQWVGH